MSTRMMNNDSSNRPPKETILLDGCDFEHWLVVMDPPDPNLTRDDIIDGYIKTLAQIVGSEEEARKSMYSVSTRHYFAFSCIVSEEVSYKIKELPKVRWVLPDSYLDVRNKNYGGEPFIDGQPVPYDPKYHEEWLRNYNNSQTKKFKDRRGDRTSTVRGRGGNTIYRHMAPSAPSPAPNPIAHAPMSRPNQNFTPAANYQNQVPPPPPMPNRDFSNMGVLPPGPRTDPSQMQNPDYQRRDMPPQGQNSYFTNKNTPVQNQDFQSNYAQPPTQNCDFQSRDVSSMRNMESPGRNIPLPPTQGQHWNSPSKDMQPPLQNQSNLLPSMQNRHFENRDMPPMQKPEFPNGSDMPPVQKPGFQNAANMSPPMQNWGMPNPAQNPGFQNVPSSNFHMPPRVENPNSQFRHTGNVPPGYQQNRDINMGVMPNNQNREIPSFTKSVNMQNRDYQGQGMPGFTNSVNMQNRDYQGRDMPSNSNSQNAHNIDQQAWGSSQNTSNGGSEALANRNF